MSGLADLFGMLVSLALTVMIFSYLIGDNAFFRIAIHIFVGVAAGFVVVFSWYSVIWPQLVVPLIAGNLVSRLDLLIPGFFAVLLVLRSSVKMAPLAGVVMAFLVGIGAATAVGGAVVGTIFPQVNQATSSLELTSIAQQPASVWLTLFNGTLLIIGTVSTLAFFHFGARAEASGSAKRPGWIEALAAIGQIFIAITFGSLYAGVLQAALAAFVERVEFLIHFIEVLLS